MDTLIKTVEAFIRKEYPRTGRAKTAATNLLLGVNWFNVLEDKRQEDLYAKESGCSQEEGVRNVLYFLKNSKPCTIEIMSGEGNVILENCLIVDYSSEDIIVLNNLQELVIPVFLVIRASESGKHIY